jgi:flagellar motor switch protein FliM
MTMQEPVSPQPPTASAGIAAPSNRRELVSQDEMDALMQGLGAADAVLDAQDSAQSQAGRSFLNTPGVHEFDIGRLPQLTLGSLPGLDALHQRLARLLCGHLYETLAVQVQVTAGAIGLRRYGDCALASADDAHASLVSVQGLPGQGLLLLENTLVHAWIDLLYGGGTFGPPKPRDDKKSAFPKISAIGHRAVGRLVQQLAGAYAQVWQAMDITPLARPARMAGLAAPDARVYVCPFHITLGALQAGFELWLPHAMLEPLLPVWRQPVLDSPARRDLHWQQRLAQSLQHVSVQLQARWRLADTPLHRVATLRLGDVISLKGLPRLEDVAGGISLFTGVLQPGTSPVQLRLQSRTSEHPPSPLNAPTSRGPQ